MMRQAGFSLTELVLIIVLLGILSTFVAVRSGSDFTAVTDAEELLLAIRYTQERAMQHTGDGQTYQVTLNGGGYSLSPLPSASYSESLDGALEGSSITPTGVIGFDGRGVPTCSAGLNCSAAPEAILIASGSDSVTLIVQPHTGFIGR